MTGDLRGNWPGTLRGIHRGSPGRSTGNPTAHLPGFSREIHRGFPGEFAGDFPMYRGCTGEVTWNLPGESAAGPEFDDYGSAFCATIVVELGTAAATWRLGAPRTNYERSKGKAPSSFSVEATISVPARSDTVLLISLVISWSLARAAAGH